MYNTVFDSIASVYGWFYAYQKRSFEEIIKTLREHEALLDGDRVLDLGCGTGAMCTSLASKGFSVTGVDASARMIDVAKKKKGEVKVDFQVADATGALPYEDDSFDLVIASHVAHGMSRPERIRLYEEMKRVSSRTVVLHDYNSTRSLITDILEYLEKGYYFEFIKVVETELRENFPSVTVGEGGKTTSLYICQCHEKSN